MNNLLGRDFKVEKTMKFLKEIEIFEEISLVLGKFTDNYLNL